MRKDDSFTLGTRYFFLACDDELRRLQADTSSAEDLNETRNRACKVSGTQGTIHLELFHFFFFYFLQSNIYSGPSISDPFSDL